MHTDQTNTAAMAGIRALAFDVDGVLTDGGVWWGPEDAEFKRFGFADIMGLSLARRAGLMLGLISGEDTPLIDRLAAKLSVAFVVKGTRDKAAALQAFAAFADVALAQVGFMGDDVNDLPALRLAGLSAAPANAAADVLAFVQFVAQRSGGHGAARDLVEALLHARGLTAEEVFSRG